jgi:hypothetical protein
MSDILGKDFRLKNLCYGHPGKFILSLSGRFDHLKIDETQPKPRQCGGIHIPKSLVW